MQQQTFRVRSRQVIALWVIVQGIAGGGVALAQTPSAAPVLSGPVSTTPTPPSTALKGSAAWQLLIGNTIVAVSRAGGYTEYYATDGVVKHLDKDGASSGRWSVEAQKVCFDFPEEDDRSCVDVEVNGPTGAFVDEDKSRDTFDVLPGNAKSL